MNQRQVKSYVLRKGRTSKRQAQALVYLLKDYQLTVQETPWPLDAIFPTPADTVVEIGFGMGASLLAMAKARADLNFIGIEVHEAGVGSLAADIAHHQLTNVRIVKHDAVEVFKTCIGSQSLAGVHIFFPDPWPKKRHHKRRLIQPDFIQLITEKIKPGGVIHCATDWQDYAEYMLEVLSAQPKLQNQEVGGGFSPRPASRPLTKFEKRGQLLGHGVWDLVFNRIA